MVIEIREISGIRKWPNWAELYVNPMRIKLFNQVELPVPIPFLNFPLSLKSGIA